MLVRQNIWSQFLCSLFNLYILNPQLWYPSSDLSADSPLLQDHVRPVRPASYRSESCVPPVITGNPGLHRHRPGGANPGAATIGSSPAPQLSITDPDWPGLRGRWSPGKEEHPLEHRSHRSCIHMWRKWRKCDISKEVDNVRGVKYVILFMYDMFF